MPITRAPSSRRHARASACSAARGSSAVSTVPASSACARRDQRSPRPLLQRSRGELPAVVVLASEPHEQVAGAGFAGVDHRPLGARRARVAAQRRPRRLRHPAGCLHRSRSRQCLAGHGHVVEGLLAAVLELLALLVALAGDHHHVAVLRLGDRAADGTAAVGLALGVRPGALHHLVDDRFRILRARVVGGHQDAVGQLPRSGAHQRPLGGVAVAAGSEHHRQPPVGHLARGAQDVVQRVGRVRVVHQHAEGLALVDRLEPPRHPPESLERLSGGPQVGAQRVHGRQRAQGVLDVEQPRQGNAQPQLALRSDAGEGRAGEVEADVARVEVGLVVHADRGRLDLARDPPPVLVVHVDHRGGPGPGSSNSRRFAAK